MPSENTIGPPNRKRKLSKEAEPALDCPPPFTAKRRKFDNHQRQRTPSSFWDNLSRQWLTRRALREFDRRTLWPAAPAPPDRTSKKTFALTQLKRFARHGGPSLGDLRAVSQAQASKEMLLTACQYSEPGTATPLHQIMTPSQSSLGKRARTGDETGEEPESAKTRRMSAYDPAFKQHLIDHGVYPEGHGGFSNVQRPNNWEEIYARLTIPRASLSPSRFGEKEFWDFREKNENAVTENSVMSKAFPIIVGTANIPSQENVLFGNLKNLTDGTITKAKPDFYDGSHPDELHKQIRAALSPYIVPSTNDSLPCVPNFFTEGKGSDGSSTVCKLQALYDGAVGARGVQELRSYIDGQASYDNNAYTITTTYHGGTGTLDVYTSHPVASTSSERITEFRMTKLGGWSMTGNAETFRQGASALRNARECTYNPE